MPFDVRNPKSSVCHTTVVVNGERKPVTIASGQIIRVDALTADSQMRVTRGDLTATSVAAPVVTPPPVAAPEVPPAPKAPPVVTPPKDRKASSKKAGE